MLIIGGAVRAGVARLDSARSTAALAELRSRGAPVPDLAVPAGTLVVLRDVVTDCVVAGGAYIVAADGSGEIAGLWTADASRRGLRRRALWELEAEARRRGVGRLAVGDSAGGDAAQAVIFAEAGYGAAMPGSPAAGKVLGKG